jgi:hypothetical protein
LIYLFLIYFLCLARPLPCRRHRQLGYGLAKLKNLFIFVFVYLKSFFSSLARPTANLLAPMAWKRVHQILFFILFKVDFYFILLLKFIKKTIHVRWAHSQAVGNNGMVVGRLTLTYFSKNKKNKKSFFFSFEKFSLKQL